MQANTFLRALSPRALSGFLLACAWLCAGNAQAQSATNGQALFTQRCSGCHGPTVQDGKETTIKAANANVTKAATVNIPAMRRLATALSDSNYNDLAAYFAQSFSVAATFIPVTVSPSALDFSTTPVSVGQSSAPLTVTVSNASATAAALTSIQVTGPFTVAPAATNGCALAGFSLPATSSCSVVVSYAPTASGAATGAVNITTDSQQIAIALKGLSGALAPTWQPAATALSFAATNVGSTSTPQSVTLSNPNTTAATLSAITIAGANASAFTIATDSTCQLNGTLAAAGTCTLNLNFAPKAAGTAAATLHVETSAGTPNDIALSGIGTVAGAALVVDDKAPSLTAAVGQNSQALVLNLTNAKATATTLSSLAVTGPFELVAGGADACGTTQAIAAGASCKLTLVFHAPGNDGDSSGSLTVQSAEGDSTVVTLAGHAVKTNVGSSDEDGGGALSLAWLALFGLAVLAALVSRMPPVGTVRKAE